MLCSTIPKFLIIFVVYNAVVFAQYEWSSVGTAEYSGSFENGNINSMYPNDPQVLNPFNSPSSNRYTRNDGYENTVYNPNAPQIQNPSSSPSFARYRYSTPYTIEAPENSYTTEKYRSLPYHPSLSPLSVHNPYRIAYNTQAPSDYNTEKNTFKYNQTVGESILRLTNSGTSIRMGISNCEIASLSKFFWTVLLVSAAAVSREHFFGVNI